MTLDDLMRVFHANYRGEGIMMEIHNIRSRAGIAAVVRALRDWCVDKSGHYNWDAQDFEDAFNEILGDAGEKAAGVLAVESRDGAMISEAPEAPAADPKVCVWIESASHLWLVNCKSLVTFRTFSKPPTNCPSCGKPIKFQEQQP